MIWYFNPDTLATAVYVLINTDSILRNGQHLDEQTSHIWKHRMPNNVTGRNLLVEVRQMIPNDIQNYTGEVRLHSRCPLISNGQIDPNANRILSRCEELLNNVSPAVSDAVSQPLVSLGMIPSFLMQGVETEGGVLKSNGVLRLSVTVGKNG